MQDTITNLCVRCGKPRVAVKKWKVHTENSMLTYTSTVCPDKACQQIVDEKLKIKQEQELLRQNRSQHNRQKNTNIKLS